jgi:hypothetical protein
MFTKLKNWFGRVTVGGTILYSHGTVTSKRGVLKQQLRVQCFLPGRGAPERIVRLDIIASAPLGFQTLPVTLRPSEARELVRFIEEAIDHCERDHS